MGAANNHPGADGRWGAPVSPGALAGLIPRPCRGRTVVWPMWSLRRRWQRLHFPRGTELSYGSTIPTPRTGGSGTHGKTQQQQQRSDRAKAPGVVGKHRRRRARRNRLGQPEEAVGAGVAGGGRGGKGFRGGTDIKPEAVAGKQLVIVESPAKAKTINKLPGRRLRRRRVDRTRARPAEQEPQGRQDRSPAST